MATLKGQNFRVAVYTGGAEYVVVAKATNCTITYRTTTNDASTKDDTGMSSKPEITSKNWQVQVESLNVTDMAAMLTAIKNMTPFQLAWDETNSANNYTAEGAAFARMGTAFLTDATFSFNDRENSSKSLQFSGSGAVESADGANFTNGPSAGYTKGQYVRLFLGSDNTAIPSTVIASAKTLQVHVSISLEDATTKDTDGDWQIQEPTALSFDISTNALVRANDTITSTVDAKSLNDLQNIYQNSTPVKFQIANVSGANQRTKGTVIMSGSVIVSQLTLNNPNRQNSTYDAQLQGYGDYTVGA